MTASKVTQVNLYANSPQPVGQVSKSAQTDEFSQIFAAQSAETENKFQEKADVEVKENDRTEVQKETVVEEATSVDENQEVSETIETEEVTESVEEENVDTEAIKGAIEEIMATIQQILGVTSEELQGAMQELGISAEDLLNTEMIPKLVVALTEGADELSVMTNEELFSNMQEITSKVESLLQDLSKQMDLTPEELKGILQNMPEEDVVLEEEIVKPVVTDNKTDVPVAEEVRVQAAVIRTESSKNADDSRRETDTGANQQMTYTQTVVEQIERTVAKTETSYTTLSNTESIMNQIRDVIRVIQTQDTTEMDLQLHPASLGHLRVQLAVKEGVLTATFTTENEAVRAALESQMVNLRQNFEAQGIKVEAVEVTVASHAFEHNLNGDGNGANEETAPEKKKNGRRITLSDLTNEIEEEKLSDEDRIVAEMMKQNGNTVDYTV